MAIVFEATSFEFVTTPTHEIILRGASSLKLTVHGNTPKLGKRLFFWNVIGDRKDGLPFTFEESGALCISSSNMCIGVKQSSLILVSADDEHICRFYGAILDIAKAIAIEKKRRLNAMPQGGHYLVLQNETKAISVLVNKIRSDGHVASVHIGTSDQATKFVFEGEPWAMAIRLAEEPTLAMGVSSISGAAFATARKPAQLFQFNADGTVSPTALPELCLGKKIESTDVKVVVVNCTSSNARMRFSSDVASVSKLISPHHLDAKRGDSKKSRSTRTSFGLKAFTSSSP